MIKLNWTETKEKVYVKGQLDFTDVLEIDGNYYVKITDMETMVKIKDEKNS